MGPERTVEMQRLEAGPLESLVQVRVPVGPELNNGEECLQDCLVLVVTTRGTQRHERLAVTAHDTWCQRVARARTWPQLCSARLVEPKLLAADAHANASVTEDDSTGNPAAARRAIEDVAGPIDDCDVGSVLYRAGHWLRIWQRRIGLGLLRNIRNPVFPLFDRAVVRQRVAGDERTIGVHWID